MADLFVNVLGRASPPGQIQAPPPSAISTPTLSEVLKVASSASAQRIDPSSYNTITSASLPALPAYLPMTSAPSWGYWLTGGATATHHASGGWNNQGYVRLTVPSIEEAYSSILANSQLNTPVPRLNVGWLFRVGDTFTQSNNNSGATGMKHFIMHASPDDDPRIMAIWHSVLGDRWDIAAGNNIDLPYAGSPNFTAGFDLTAHENEWLFLEVEMRRSGDSPNLISLWLTCDNPAHGFNETLISTQASNQSNNFGFVEFIGNYGAWITAPNAGANDWFDVGQVFMKTSYIGPPAGFH